MLNGRTIEFIETPQPLLTHEDACLHYLSLIFRGSAPTAMIQKAAYDVMQRDLPMEKDDGE